MKHSPTVPIAFSGMPVFIEKYGDDIWKLVCDRFPVGEPFRTAEVAELIYIRYGWARNTSHRYAYTILRNVLEQPLPDNVEPAIRRINHSQWML